jgi:hypothetical protein
VDHLVVQASGEVDASGATVTINDGTPAVDCDVFGTMQVLNVAGSGVAISGGAGLSFENGGVFIWNRTNAPAIPAATWNNGSACSILATSNNTATATGISGQNFYDLSWDTTAAGQSARCRWNLTGTTTVRHNLSINIPNTANASITLGSGAGVVLTVGGNVNFVTGNGQNTTKILLNNTAGNSLTIKVAGSFSFSSTGYLDGFGSTTSTIEFNGGAQSLIIPTGSFLLNPSTIGYQVDSGSVLTLNSLISGCGTFAVNDGGKLIFNGNKFTGGSILYLSGNAMIVGNGTNTLTSAMASNHYGGTLDFGGGLPAFNLGDSFKPFGATLYGGTFSAFVPATPGSGQVWDQTQLDISGTLAVGSPGSVPPTLNILAQTANSLTLGWSVGYLGWSLQGQTNSTGSGYSNYWTAVSGSKTTNQLTIPIDPSKGVVLFRLSQQ